MKCVNCGKEFNGKFCPGCGNSAQSNNKTQHGTAAANADAKSSKKKPVIIAVCIVLVLAVCGCGVLIYNVSHNSSANKKQTTVSDNNSNAQKDTNESALNSDAAEETESAFVEPLSVTCKELCQSYKEYAGKLIKTTIKVKGDDEDSVYYYTHDFAGYDTVRVSISYSDLQYKKYKPGSYITVTASVDYEDELRYAGEYGEERTELKINLKADSIEKTDKTLFEAFGSNKMTDVTDNLTELYSNKAFDLYYLTTEAGSKNSIVVKMIVKNKTKEKLTFYANSMIIDGHKYSEENSLIMYEEIEAGSTTDIGVTIKECTNLSPEKLGGSLHCSLGYYLSDNNADITFKNIKVG